MQHLKTITLINFQPHKKLKVKLGKITTITGPNDAGKSSLLRAIRWLATNKPNGSDFIRHGAKACRISIHIDNHHIDRIRSNNKNLYIIDGKEYRSFGSKVPSSIKKIINLTDVNFQRSFDPPFWLSEKPGDLSKLLNRIVNLDVVDKTLHLAGVKLHRAKVTCSVVKEQLKKAKTARSSLSWADRAMADLNKLNDLNKAIARISARAGTLANQVKRHKRAALVNNHAAKAAVDAQALEAVATTIGQQQHSAERLELLLGRAQRHTRDICQREKQIGEVSKELKRLMKERCPVCGQSTKKIRS